MQADPRNQEKAMKKAIGSLTSNQKKRIREECRGWHTLGKVLPEYTEDELYYALLLGLTSNKPCTEMVKRPIGRLVSLYRRQLREFAHAFITRARRK